MIFKKPGEKEFEQVKQLAKDFWLDNSAMQPEQFRVISDSGRVIAFGRLREYEDATELGTLGVAENSRRKGWGSKMVLHLLEQAKRDVYVVTTMFGFNAKLGFIKVDEYPDSIKKKMDICGSKYHVEEPYFVMKWEKKEI